MFVDILIICCLFLVGLIVARLAIVLGLKSPLKNKEYFNICDNCNNRYKWYQMIPFFSFFLDRGKCKYCNKKLNIAYPFMELISGILFSFSYIIYGFSYEMWIMIILIFLTINIYVSDFKYYIILDDLLFLISILVLGLKWYYFGFETFLISLCSGILIFIFMMMIRFIGNKIFKKESIGGGDIKLATLFGFLLGLRLSIVSLVLGSFLAFPYAFYCSLSGKDQEIPFGPFLVTGLDFVFFFMKFINSFLETIFG